MNLFGYIHHRTARFTGPEVFTIVELLENGRQLVNDIRERKELLMQLVVAILTIPLEGIKLFFCAVTFYNQTHCVGRSAW
jgi:hypothetical protein